MTNYILYVFQKKQKLHRGRGSGEPVPQSLFDLHFLIHVDLQIFRHWAGVSPYTWSYDFAESLLDTKLKVGELIRYF